jgi:glycosyltransferase involved in cell wall biosynthesis
MQSSSGDGSHADRNHRKVLVANLSAPELGYLAAELARRQSLLAYVRRYGNQNRSWERLLARLPLGQVYSRTLGRRSVPPGLARGHIVEAGVLFDFGAAITARLGLPAALVSRGVADLHRRATAAIGKKAARLADGADAIVAGSGTAWAVFNARDARSAARILNYPSAHHRFQRRFFAAQAEKLPAFAGLADDWGTPSPAANTRLDEECEMADVILTGSRFAGQSFVEEGLPAEKIVTIPYGVDLRRFTPNGRPSRRPRFRITYVGRISSHKGVGYLLEAYRRFRRPDTELQLVGNIVGDAGCLLPYRDLFTHVPHVPQSQLPDIYRSSDVFVFPSLLEGLGLVALEAMACGCPVIVSRNGPGDVVRDGIDGIVVPAADADALLAAMDLLYRDAELCLAMSQSARRQAETFGWERYAARAADVVMTSATRN